MNYKNLVFTALMSISFMSRGTEPAKPQSSSSWSSWTPWALGGATVGMSVKCAYHYIKSARCLRQQKQLKNERDQIINSHNQKVVNTGREPNPDTNSIRDLMVQDGILPADLANIAVEYSRPQDNWKDIKLIFFLNNKKILFTKEGTFYPIQEVEDGAQGGNFDLSGPFRLLTVAEKISLSQDKQLAQTLIQNNTQQTKSNASKIKDQRDNLQVAGGLAIICGVFSCMHYFDSFAYKQPSSVSTTTTRGR